jgi:DNA-binding CsgD family transcriptional regulator/DNA replicative helicase MCM subunit Mcm2 (Cdc46/Mcm family)
MRLVGREDELAALQRIAEAPTEQAILVVGEPGVGKSRLLEALHSSAPIRSVLVHTPVSETGAALSGLARVLAFVDDACSAALAGNSAEGAPATSAAVDAVRALVLRRRSAPSEPVLVLVDDVDRLDSASQRLLAFLAEGLHGTGLRFVGTAVSAAAMPHLATLRQMELPRLSPQETRALAAQALGAGAQVVGSAAARVEVELLAEASLGVPAAVLDYAEAARGRALVLPLRPGASQRRLTQSTLQEAALLNGEPPAEGAGDATVRLLELISLAPITHVDAVAQEPAGPGLLDDLRRSGVLAGIGDHVSIADPRVRSALAWGMDPAFRRSDHRQLAALHRGIDDRLALWHASHGEGVRQPAADLLEAARDYAEEGSIAAAFEFAERARLVGLASADAARLGDLVISFLLHDELDLAEHFVALALSLGEPTQRTHLESLRFAIEFRRSGSISDIEVDAALALPAGTDADAVDLLSLAAVCHIVRWEVDDARERLARAIALGVSDPGELHAIQHLVDAIDGAPATSAPLLTSEPHLLLLRAAAQMYRERYTDARRTLAVVLGQPHSTPPLWITTAHQLRAITEIRAGSFQRAVDAVAAWAPPAVSRAHRVGQPDESATALLFRGWVQSVGPDAAPATSTFERAADQALAEGNPAVAALAFAAQGASALADGAVLEAIRTLELADAIGARFANPALLRHSVDLVEAYVLGDRKREARVVLDALELAAEKHPSRWVRIALARGRALVAPDDRSLSLYLRALELFGPDDSPFDHGRTLVNFAFAQARLGFPRESEKSLAAARNAFAMAGVPGWVGRLQRGLTAAHPHSLPTVGVLTEEEQLIVEKVREGYRNKEIAAALFISLRTVELRLTHIYRKVGARSRSHLAALLG